MKLDKVKEAFNAVFEEDEALKYALATNIAKYGRPQSKPSDKPAKLTKGLEKKREKAVKDLKKVMDEEINLVHVYDKDGKMFGTGERISSNNGKTLVRFDGSTEKEFDSSQVKNVSEQEDSPFPGPDFNNKGYIAARDLIDRLRATVFRKLNDDELEEFRKTIADAFDLQLKEGLSENFDKVSGGIPYKVENGNAIISIPLPDDAKERIIKRAKENGYSASPNMAGGVTIRKKGLNEDEGTLNKISDMLSRKFDDLRFDVNTMSDRIDVRGSRSDLADFGEELQGKKIFDYEIFYIEEDPGERGAIVRIVKSDSISRGGVNEEMDPKEMKTGTYVGKKVVIHMHGPETEWKVEFIDTGKIVDYVDLMANLKFDDGTTYMDYLKEKKDEAYSGFMRSTPDPNSEPFKPTGSVAQFREELEALFGKFKGDLKNPEFIKGVAQIMVNWKSLLRSQLDEKAKKADRCLRIARRKMPQSSAYRSGLIVKCRKGMIWKKEK